MMPDLNAWSFSGFVLIFLGGTFFALSPSWAWSLLPLLGLGLPGVYCWGRAAR
jgi:hypothetical protein